MSEEIANTVNQGARATSPVGADAGKSVANVVYALQAVSFILGITYLVAVIVNYIKRSDVRGTWLESHFRWQIRTFWFSLLWLVIGSVTAFIIVGYFVLFANAIWIIYRILKGWLRLNDGKEMYA